MSTAQRYDRPEVVDPQRQPRLAAYLSRLPAGIESHPDSRCKASVVRGALDALPGEMDLSTLPADLASFIETPPPRNTWLPETINMAFYLAVADQHFGDDDEAFLHWVYGIGKAVFRSPMYRILMFVASPERLARGAERRWSAFHRGSDYELEAHPWGTVSTITYPEHLFPRLGVEATTMAIKVAYRASGARKAQVEVIEYTPTSATIRSTWYPGE